MSADPYLDTLDDVQREAEAIRGANIDADRKKLVTAVVAALEMTRQAEAALYRLMSGDVFDIEFAEGTQGTDVAAHLAEAARSLRAVKAIHRNVIGSTR